MGTKARYESPEGDAIRRLLAPLVEGHGLGKEDARRTLDNSVAALPVTADVLATCANGPQLRETEVDTLACLLAAAIRAHDHLASERLHALLSLCETVALLLRFADEEAEWKGPLRSARVGA